MTRSYENCGWGDKKSGPDVYCVRKRMTFSAGSEGLGLCPCLYWVKKSEIGPKKSVKSRKSGG